MSADALYDSHLHLDPEDARAIASAREAGVDRALVPSVAPSGWDALASLRDRTPEVRIALGAHPLAIDDLDERALDAALAALSDRARRLGAVAIGECGLDARMRSSLARQSRALDAQLAVARELGRPIVLHVVRADAAALACVDRHPGVRGVLHGFTGAPDTARRWIARGWAIGIGARVVDPSARRARECAALLPLEHVVVETDDAGPARLPDVVRTIAELRGVDPDEIRRATHRNASALFG